MRTSTWALGLALGLSAAANAAPIQLTLESAVATALEASPVLKAARQRQRASAELATSAGRRLLPALRLSDEHQHYDDAFTVGFGAGPGVVAREEDTQVQTVSLQQPVLGLLRLREERGVQVENAQAGRARLAATADGLRQEVETQYLRCFEARALDQIASAAVEELSEQVRVARARLETGVVTRADVLRLEVAVANARQQGLSARSQAAAARAALLALLGWSAATTEVELAEPTALLEATRQEPPALALAWEQAQRRRPELAEQRHLAAGARRQAHALALALLPEVDLEANYQRVHGQVFLPEHTRSVGLKARWTAWEWGASAHQWRAAAAQAAASRWDLEARQAQLAAELTASLAQDQATRGAVLAAETTIRSAEEAYRVTEAEIQAGTANTTDLLEAQAALTQARLNLTRAQYELALVRVALRRSLDENP
ncbi:MAG: TolC family protein [Candidatus Latescibacteria bacterium]|nr:TolC family protein [Candidatus Latescibacterota bacterium]